MIDTTQTWSVVTASEGHPDQDPGTTYSVSATGLTLDAALALVSDIEHAADEAYDDCGCEPSEVDGDIRCRCTGYPIVSAFHCLDAEARKYVPNCQIIIPDRPSWGEAVLPHYAKKPVPPEDEPIWAYRPKQWQWMPSLYRPSIGRRYIRSAPRDGTTIVVGRPGVGEWLVRWDEDIVNPSVGNYPGMWVTTDGKFTWQDHPELGPSYWRAA